MVKPLPERGTRIITNARYVKLYPRSRHPKRGVVFSHSPRYPDSVRVKWDHAPTYAELIHFTMIEIDS